MTETADTPALGGPVLDPAGAGGARARPLAALRRAARVAPTSTPRSRTCAPCEDAGLLDADEAAALEEALARGRRRRSPTGRFAFARRRRGRPLGDRAGRHRPARRPRARSCTRAARRNDLVVTDLRLWLLDAGRRIDGLVVVLVRDADRACPRARGDRDARHHARAARAARHARPPPARARVGARARPRAPATSGRCARRPSARSAPARSATSTLGLDPGSDRRPPRHAPGVRELDRRRERPRLRAGVPRRRGDLRHAPVAARGRPRPVDRRVARLGGARRGLLDRVEHDAAEAEPRHRRARARQGCPRRRRLRVGSPRCCRACRSATTATCRRTRSPRSTPPTRWSSCCPRSPARSRRCGSTSRRCAPRARAEGLYATDLAEALVRDGVPFREAHRRTGELLKRVDERRTLAARPHRRGVDGVRRAGRRRAARPRSQRRRSDDAGGTVDRERAGPAGCARREDQMIKLLGLDRAWSNLWSVSLAAPTESTTEPASEEERRLEDQDHC